MKVVDLTHALSPNMPVYPGTEQPTFKVGCSIAADGFLEKEITMYSHTGTHIDAPAHLIEGLKTLDQLPIQHYYGRALLLDFQDNCPDIIEIEHISDHKELLTSVDFLLINTGWNKHWGTDKYFSGFPVLSQDAAQWLSERNLKGIGLDAISADHAETVDFPIHKVFFQNNIIIIENLVNLECIGTDLFKFSCFPLFIEEADGSPVRAIAYLE